MYAAIDAYPDLRLDLRMELKATVEAIEAESERGEEAREDRFRRYLTEVRDSAPGLFELFTTVLTDREVELNPALRQTAKSLR